jgi:8-oxo-dGTP diphosphatase
MATIPDSTWPKIPHVGVGCIVVRGDGQLLMVQNHRGFWSTPGGHLDFGESPAECAARETFEEAGLRVAHVEFVAITNDVLPDAGRHYVTIWMRAGAADLTPVVRDPDEIAAAGWFAPDALPRPLHLYFENLIAGRSLPPNPANLPFTLPVRGVTGAGA